MNKAFVRESDTSENDGDDSEPQEDGLTQGAPNYITTDGYRRLQDELQQLLKVERPKTVEIVSWAASNGDRSENGDYIYGKRRLREIDKRLRYLTKRLSIAKVVNPLDQPAKDQVFFGARVRIEDADGLQNTYRIVGVDEISHHPENISWVSPMARALMKARVDDAVTVQSPAGPREVVVLQVSYD